ncbi:MAG: eL32 family ribosomal protein [Candidatus Marsarchaeota archaeon]|nr:eL32 family ribosomal protein [Candidatus Marsarchaeota archaeon]
MVAKKPAIRKVKKKQHPKFNVPNYGAKNRLHVKSRWRKQRGQDNKKRIKKDFMGATPGIGYRNAAKDMGVRVDGKKLLLVHNMAELNDAMHNAEIGSYNIVIAHDVGKRKRLEMQKVASSGNVRIVNGVRK